MGTSPSVVASLAQVPHARVTGLAHDVASWRDALAHSADDSLHELRASLASFCRAMHRAGVRGPQVRRLAGAVVRAAFDGRVPDEQRERVARGAQRIVDVIYLTGEHRSP